jgi:hypothetical protein
LSVPEKLDTKAFCDGVDESGVVAILGSAIKYRETHAPGDPRPGLEHDSYGCIHGSIYGSAKDLATPPNASVVVTYNETSAAALEFVRMVDGSMADAGCALGEVPGLSEDVAVVNTCEGIDKDGTYISAGHNMGVQIGDGGYYCSLSALPGQPLPAPQDKSVEFCLDTLSALGA